MVRSHVILLLTVLTIAFPASLAQNADSSNGLLRLQRVRRQESTTTPSPPKRRPSNVFSLISVLLRETRDDARRAFGEIGRLFNSQFSDSTTQSPRPFNGQAVATTTTEASSGSASENSGDEVTTTTEPYRISRNEFNGILNSNFRGIVTLFGKEFRNAIRDSGKNVVQFGRDFRDQIRPYVTPNRTK